jgi:PAT family beta-lactamase induction signal transducer AmpG
MPWRSVYLIMAALMAVGALSALLAEEPDVQAPPPPSLREAVLEPFQDFFKRNYAVQLLIFVLIYKLGDMLAVYLLNQFLISQGFELTEIGLIKKWCGIIALIVGSLVGGGIISKIGMKRALIYFGILQAGFILTFVAMSLVGQSFPLLIFAVLSENLCVGMASSAFVAFLMSLCNKRFTATQYALLSSMAAVSRSLIASGAGYAQKYVGWTSYFLICIGLAVPGLLMVIRYYDRWVGEEDRQV